jgi:D-3-phosphoglycerate dehydrogenase
MTKTILVATEKPFASEAIDQMKKAVANFSGYELKLLEKYTDKAQLIEAVKEADAMIIRSDKATREVVEAGKKLKVIVRAGAGFDNIDLQACTDNNVVAMNTPGQNSNAVAELAIGMMIFIARCKFSGKSGTELKGKRIGIHAYGNVGRGVATIAKGFGMEVGAFDPFVSAEKMQAEGIKVYNKIEDMYADCHYVSLHIPANDKTKKSINFDLLKLMPKDGTLVNTARKEVICEDGLKKVLAERPDFKYVSDIAPDNKVELESEFGDQVFFTPKKMGAQSAEANINAGVAGVNQIVEFFENGDIRFKVN